MGKAANAFLQEICSECWLVCAMMSDGAVEAMALIRHLDNEDLDVTTLSHHVQHFLDHITWMFFEKGVFSIHGHTSFIMVWYSKKVHHFYCGNIARSMGGAPFPNNVIEKVLNHMQSWVHLVKEHIGG